MPRATRSPAALSRLLPLLFCLFILAGCVIGATFAHYGQRQVSVIEGSTSSFPTIDKARADQLRMRDRLIGLLDPADASSIFRVFTAIDRNDALSRDCHEIGHDVGHRAYELYGFSGAMALGNGDSGSYLQVGEICAGGYMHGILEEAMVTHADLKRSVEDLCARVPSGNRASCFHGIGHGVMFVEQRDLPRSLADCRHLTQVVDRGHCDEGVWMEFYWGDGRHAPGKSLGWSADDPLAPCLQAPPDARNPCFLYANLGYLRAHPKDFAGAVALCGRLGLSENDAAFCLKGAGMTLMQSVLEHKLPHPEALVAGLSDARRNAYYRGLIAYARLSGISDDNLRIFCRGLETDASMCLTIIRTVPR